jgi:hypothetical protein
MTDRRAMLAEMFYYYGKEDQYPTVAHIYLDRLADIPCDQLELAIIRAYDTATFMPKVAELRKLHVENMARRAGVPLPSEAWGEVSRHLMKDRYKKAGGLYRVNFLSDHTWSHELVRKAAEQIGWQAMVANRTGIGMDSNRKQYLAAYQGLVNKLKTEMRIGQDVREKTQPAERQLPAGEKKQTALPEPPEQIDAVPMPQHVREKLDELCRKDRR